MTVFSKIHGYHERAFHRPPTHTAIEDFKCFIKKYVMLTRCDKNGANADLFGVYGVLIILSVCRRTTCKKSMTKHRYLVGVFRYMVNISATL